MNKGGEVAGKGSYGIVYINPRPNCQGEKNRKRNDEAGKVFFRKDEQNRYIGEQHALEEMHSFQQIRKQFPKSMKTIKKYTILPEKKCLIQHKQLPKDPKWYTDKKKTIYPEIQDLDVTDMIVYEKANTTAEDAFKKIQTEEEFMEYVSMMNQLEKGIRLLHKHELYHNDIKGDNIVMIEETDKTDSIDKKKSTNKSLEKNITKGEIFRINSENKRKSLKLIDFGFLLQGADNPEFDDLAVRLDYQPYPSSVLSLTNIEDPETRGYIIDKIEKSRHSSRFESIYKNLYEPFHKHLNLFKSNMKHRMEKMCKILMTEKSVGFMGFYQLAQKCSTEQEWEIRFPEVMDQFIDYLRETIDINPYFKKLSLSRKELCEKIDRYSLGIVMLQMLKRAPNNVMENKLFKLYKKAFELCHIQSKSSSNKTRKRHLIF